MALLAYFAAHACGGATELRGEMCPAPASPAASVAMGLATHHFCVLDRAGRVRCHGANWAGQLGGGRISLADQDGVTVAGLDDVIQVQVDPPAAVSCALRRSGQVYCWGSNEDGRLGVGHAGDERCETTYGRFRCRRSPTLVAGLEGVKAIALNATTSCALRDDGRVSCWGESANALAAPPGSTPALAPGLSGVTGLWPGFLDMVVRTADGEVVVLPVNVSLPFARGAEFGASMHGAVCATRPDGRVSCFGSNRFGLLGAEDRDPSRRIADLPIDDVRAMAVGLTHACALKRDGSVWCWGDADGGALGVVSASFEVCEGFRGASVACLRHPRRIEGIRDAVAISATDRFSCALLRDDSVWCWGRRHEGEIWGAPVRTAW